jgi:hypothetical protein
VVDSEEDYRLSRHETSAQRLDRNLNELLGELRIALPGVQVLFAFLLTVPFTQRFATLSGFEEGLYFAVLLFTAISSALLIAPTAYHRLQFRRGRKHELVLFANRAALAGLGFLALAMTGAILLITHVLFGPAAAVPTAVAAGTVFAGLWYVVPLLGPGD